MKKIMGVLAFAAALIIASAAVAQERTVDSTLATDENVTIKKLEITGNFEVPDEEITGVIQSKVGDPISTQTLEEDLQKIFDLGYFSEDVKVSLSEFEGGAKVVFKVVENPVITKITISGNTAIPTQNILDSMKTKENKILNKLQLKEDIATIEKLYKDKGYIVARVGDLAVSEKGELKLAILEGTIQDIEIVYIVKNEDDESIIEKNPTGKTRPIVILREMKTKAGDILNVEKLKRDLQRVFNLGLFEDVSWDFNTDPDKVELGKIVMQIQVQEAKTGQVGFGAGYSSNTGLTGFLSYSERNLSGKARRITTSLEFGKKRDDFQVGYFEPWIDKKQTSFEVNVYNTSQQDFRYGLGGISTTDYEEIHRGFNFTVGRPVSDNTRAYVGFKIENVNVEPEAYDYLDGAARAMTLTLRTDTRDNIFFPTRGRFDTGSSEFNGGFLGGDYDYQKFNLDLRRFHPVKNKQVLAFHMFMGVGKNDVPRFDYYDIGGVNTVRGYDEYQFSGTKAIYFNAEYRINMGSNLSGVLFADAGGTWMSLDEMSIDPKDYVKSVGAGLRLQIPQLGGFGPIRLDYAYALSIEDSKIHFGFGHMF